MRHDTTYCMACERLVAFARILLSVKVLAGDRVVRHVTARLGCLHKKTVVQALTENREG